MRFISLNGGLEEGFLLTPINYMYTKSGTLFPLNNIKSFKSDTHRITR